MNLINKIRKGWVAMEKRKILTSHTGLALLARERIVVGRFMTLADAVHDHEGRIATLPAARRPHDEALYSRLREVGGERAA
jgi:hypothetical protein